MVFYEHPSAMFVCYDIIKWVTLNKSSLKLKIDKQNT